MKRTTFWGLVVVTMVALQASSSLLPAAAETWQSYLQKAQQTLHIPQQKAIMHKAPVVPHNTPEDLKKGRAYLEESIKLAQTAVPPLAALKDQATAKSVVELTWAVDYVNQLDAATLAKMFADYQKTEATPAGKLALLRRCQVIGKRLDVLDTANTEIIDKAFGTKGEKVQWQVEGPNKAEIMAALKQFPSSERASSIAVHKSVLAVDQSIKQLEKSGAGTAETWQSCLQKAQQTLHIPQEKAIMCKPPVVPHNTPKDLKKGRAYLEESMQLAQPAVPPLGALKDAATAKSVTDLAWAVDYFVKLDSDNLAKMLADFEKMNGTRAEKLAFLRRCDVMGKKLDAMDANITDIVEKAFGTKGEKVQWQVEGPNKEEIKALLEHFPSYAKDSSNVVHKLALAVDYGLKKLENSGAGKEAGGK